MKAAAQARWALIVLVLLAAAVGLWRFTARDATPPVTVSHGQVELVVSGPGTVQARVPVSVSARVSAQVVSLHADHGERVARGQLLALLDDRDVAAKRAAADSARHSNQANIAAAQANVDKAKADLELARNKHQRDAELYKASFISQSAYDASALGLKAAEAAAQNAAATLGARNAEARGVAEEARYAEAVWSHTRITAPMNGLVIQRAVEPGTMVAPGMTLFRLVDPNTLWVSARIDEALAGKLEEGMAATIRLRSGEVHAGRVARISRQSDAATRELEVNVAFEAPPARFAIDQEAEVRIVAGTARGPAVPVAALAYREGRQGIYVLRDGRKVFQPLRIAASDGSIAIVAEGLDSGARLAAWTSR